MTGRFDGGKRHPGRRAFMAAALALAMLTGRTAVAADRLIVRMDEAKLASLPSGASTVVVGNPLIADVSIQSGGLMVVTGKGYGTTNLIALDRSGKVLMERDIQVQGPHDIVVVYRGVDRESYSCAPKCERRITLGDTPDYFDATINQTGTLSGKAQGNASASGSSAR